jgi:transmembrane sensor
VSGGPEDAGLESFPLDAERLDGYFAGEATPAEVEAVRAWVGGRAERQAILTALRMAAREGAPEARRVDVDAAWGAARRRLDLRRGLRRAPRRVAAGVMRLAAAIVVAVGVGVLWRTLQHRETASGGRTFAAASAERTAITLEDGTGVMLAPGSRIRVATDYGHGTRDVYLDGQAYFQVTHDPRHPFAVHAANALIRDIGTRFGVRAYPEDRRVRVVVTDGVVALADSASTRGGMAPRLAAGAVGEIDRAGAVGVTTGVDTVPYLSWTAGRLAFRDTPLREALPELGRWYNLDFRVAGPVPDSIALSATFGTEPVAHALAALGVALNMRVVQVGRAVTLTPILRTR